MALRGADRLKRRLIATVALLPLASCATGGGEPTPERPAMNVPGNVSAVDRDRIVGTWVCRELNPYPNMPSPMRTVTYGTDGKAKQAAVVDALESAAGLNASFNASSTYDWAVRGGQLTAANIESTITAADDQAGSTLLAPIAQMMAASAVEQIEPITSDVLELSTTTLVARASGVEDPPVISCTRN